MVKALADPQKVLDIRRKSSTITERRYILNQQDHKNEN
jgi:hypothetical protein